MLRTNDMSEKDETRKVEFEITENRPVGPIRENMSASRGTVAAQVQKLDLDAVSAAVGDVIDRMAGFIKPREGGPSQCEVEFAVKVTADSSIVISKIGGEVSLKVKVTWAR